jgi:arylformamidase
VRQELCCQLDVSYGPTRAEHLDIFPAEQPNAPILIFLHGGYWCSLSSKEYSLVAYGPVSAGVTTLVVNYALCPHVTIDEIVRQCRAAIAWTYHNAASFSSDPDCIYVAGHSAGGHLTAMALLTAWKADYGLPPDIIKGGCAISGLYDLAPLPYTFVQPSLQLTWDQILRNSPILHLPTAAAPLLVSYGGQEPNEFRRQSDDFLAAWLEKGLDGTFLPQPDKNHFNAIDGFTDATSPLCRAVLRHMQLPA